MKLRGLTSFIFAALAFAGAADAAPPARTEVLGKAAEGAAICAAAMPDSRATSSALVANGFSLADANGPLKAYSALGNRVVVMISSPTRRDKVCLVAVGSLSEAEALQLINPWLDQSQASPVQVVGGFTHGWLGSFKGGPIELAITRNTDLFYFTGRAILARTAMNP